MSRFTLPGDRYDPTQRRPRCNTRAPLEMRPRTHVATAQVLITSLIGLIILVACAALAVVAFGTRRIGPNAPPARAARDSWHWVAAAPGTNIYIAYPEARRDGSLVSAWVDREFSSNLASVNASRIELRQFDCARRMSRRSSSVDEHHTLMGRDHVTVSSSVSSWTIAHSGTPEERVLLVVCGHSDSQFPELSGDLLELSPRLAASSARDAQSMRRFSS